VLGDVVSAARRHMAGGTGVGESTRANLPIVSIAHVTTRYQITLEVSDEQGVLATIAGLLSEGDVSVATLVQTVDSAAEETGSTARLIIGTHRASDRALSAAVERLTASDVVERVVSVLRVEGE
jgi:homoserine dehydrogenase